MPVRKFPEQYFLQLSNKKWNENQNIKSPNRTLVGRIEEYNSKNICNVNITKYVLNDSYRASVKAKLTKPTIGVNGVVDSI